jgi:hypothetical protein
MSTIFGFAGTAKPISEAKSEQITASCDRIFEAQLVSITSTPQYQGVKMSQSLLEAYNNLDKALMSGKKVIERHWDKQGRIIPPTETARSNNLSNDPFLSEEEDIEQTPNFSHTTFSLTKESTQFNYDEVTIETAVELKISAVLKGDGHAGDVITLKMYDPPYIACPHVMSLGPMKKTQRFFLIKNPEGSLNTHNYLYQLVETKSP